MTKFGDLDFPKCGEGFYLLFHRNLMKAIISAATIPLLAWVSSYLNSRTQAVNLSLTLSKSRPNINGVIQGSYQVYYHFFFVSTIFSTSSGLVFLLCFQKV